MSGFRESMRRTQRLTIIAKEEQHRLGHPEIHVEHLLLALLAAGQESSTAMTEAGMTIERTRQAVDAYHGLQIGTLSLPAPSITPGRLAEPSWTAAVWSEAALDVMRKCDLKNGDGELLIALIDEPSGRVKQIVEATGVAPDSLCPPARTPEAREGSALSPMSDVAVQVFAFVNAPVEQVWDVLRDPRRRVEWEHPFVEQVQIDDDTSFTTTAPSSGTSDQNTRVHPDRRRISYTLITADTPRRLEWSLVYPDRPKTAGTWHRGVTLEGSGAGTRLTLTDKLTHPRRPGPVRRVLLRFFLRQGLTQRAAALDRFFR